MARGIRETGEGVAVPRQMMKRILREILIMTSVLVTCSIPVWSGEQEKQSSEDRINAWATSHGKDRVSAFRQIIPDDVEAIAKYMGDPVETEGFQRGYGLAHNILEYSENKDLRRAMVLGMIKSKKDGKGNLKYTDLFVMYCVPDDFSEECKRYILDGALVLEQAGRIYGNVIQLIGLAEVREALPIFERVEAREWKKMGHDPLVPGPGEARDTSFLHNAITWHCLVARARWGDKSAMDRAINVIDSLPVETDRVGMASQLIMYTARKEAIEYALPFFYSDAHLDPRPNFGETYGRYILGALLTAIPDLPLNDGLEGCRKWMKEHENDYQIRVRTQSMASTQAREEYEKREKASKDQGDKKDGTPSK